MLIIENILVDDQVASAHFQCDLARCKGACCTFAGGSGAPLEPEEVAEVEAVLPIVWNQLSSAAQGEIRQYGAIEWEDRTPVIRCVDGRACVFVVEEQGIARCAIEKAYHAGKTTFRKPISCHLFPIREIRRGTLTILLSEYILECQPGWERGRRDQVLLTETVRDALIRRFGPQWYAALQELQQQTMTVQQGQ